MKLTNDKNAKLTIKLTFLATKNINEQDDYINLYND